MSDQELVERPNAARTYDYLLGGFNNFEVDRLMAEKVLQIYPHLRLTAHINRAFLRRAVHFLVDQGIDQFLDVGSGLPTLGHVHEVAQAVNPLARVAYVDIDPVAVALGRSLLTDNPHAVAVRADMCRPDEILGHPEITGLLDFSRPMAVLLLAVLHWIPDDEAAYGTVGRFLEAAAPGSFLAITHGTPETQSEEVRRPMLTAARQVSDNKQRSPEEIERFFAGLELVEPGLVLTPLWRPEGPDDLGLDAPERGLALAAVGRKPL